MKVLIILFALAASASAQAVDQLRQGFDQRCGQAATARDEQLAKLHQSYQTALERLLEKTKSAGNLDTALPIHQELEALKHPDANLPPLPDNAPAELKPLRTKYLDSRQQILKTHATTLGGLADKMEAALKTVETDLTKAGKIADALAARESREKLEEDPDIRAARDLLKLGGTGGKPRAALQLRRYGDSLEVLVFYDRLGKISMDSPVENVREKTGDGKELGNTKAKVLGEFVGAKGYKVDPFISFQHVFNSSDPGKMESSEMASRYNFVIDDAKGVRISYGKDAKYPYCHFVGVAPPETGKGTYQFTARYFVPKSNRSVAGFRLMQGEGGGAPVGGVLFEDRGKWAITTAVSESVNKSTNLVLCLNMPEGVKIADAMDDFIVLGEVRVEHLKFSAYIQRRVDASGRPEREQNDPQLQPALICNGDFVVK